MFGNVILFVVCCCSSNCLLLLNRNMLNVWCSVLCGVVDDFLMNLCVFFFVLFLSMLFVVEIMIMWLFCMKFFCVCVVFYVEDE